MRLRRTRVASAVAVATAALALSACSGKTTGVTNVTATSANLHSIGQCDKGESCKWYWEYWPASQPRSAGTKTTVVGPVGQTPSNVPLSWPISKLDPNTAYRWVFCGSNNGGANYFCVGPKGQVASPTADPPPDFGTFTTAPGDWNIQASPAPTGSSSSLSSVSCPSATACTAVGSYTDTSGTMMTLAERWDGNAWTIVPTPNPAGATSSQLLHVSCTSASACMAVGYSRGAGSWSALAERWDGSAWTIVTTPSPTGATSSQLFGVSCTSASSCTAVGTYSTGSGSLTLAERWDGSSWIVQTTPNPPGGGQLAGVSCTSATSCTAVGYQPAIGESWDGTTWTLQSMPASVVALPGVSCTSSTVCTAAGIGTGISDPSTAIAKWNGSTWAADGSYTRQAGFLWDVTCASPTACVAVGLAGIGGGPADRLAQRWNGSGWVTQSVQVPPGATESSLNGVSCAPGAPCTAVGYYRTGSSLAAFVVRSAT